MDRTFLMSISNGSTPFSQKLHDLLTQAPTKKIVFAELAQPFTGAMLF
jgi:hypothetical protein